MTQYELLRLEVALHIVVTGFDSVNPETNWLGSACYRLSLYPLSNILYTLFFACVYSAWFFAKRLIKPSHLFICSSVVSVFLRVYFFLILFFYYIFIFIFILTVEVE